MVHRKIALGTRFGKALSEALPPADPKNQADHKPPDITRPPVRTGEGAKHRR